MDDGYIIDWIEEHVEAIYTQFVPCGSPYLSILWTDVNGQSRCTSGFSLRDAVRGAIIVINGCKRLQGEDNGH